MSSLLSHHVPSIGPTQAAWTRVLEIVRSAVAEWQLRRALRSLDTFDERMLHDIGLTRGAVENAVRYGRRRHGAPGEIDVSATTAPLMPPSWTEWR